MEAKPCPFCGESSGVSITDNDSFRWRTAVCNACGASAPEVRRQTLGEGTNEEWESDARKRAVEEWNSRKPQLRLLGYVRREVLDLCRHNENTASLTVVPVAPKTGRWVALYVEGEAE